jgi:predicted small lipoprotein YifL
MTMRSFFLAASLATTALLSACGIKGSLEVPTGSPPPAMLDRLLSPAPAVKSPDTDANTNTDTNATAPVSRVSKSK